MLPGHYDTVFGWNDSLQNCIQYRIHWFDQNCTVEPSHSFWFYLMLSFLQGKVCGLCGNYDGNAKNEFTTRNQEIVVDPVAFGNSWSVSASCPAAVVGKHPCASNPYRASWSQKQCSIINSNVFTACHSQVWIPNQWNILLLLRKNIYIKKCKWIWHFAMEKLLVEQAYENNQIFCL